jgi:hypothetical protein
MRKLSESIDIGLPSFHQPRHLVRRDFPQEPQPCDACGIMTNIVRCPARVCPGSLAIGFVAVSTWICAGAFRSSGPREPSR